MPSRSTLFPRTCNFAEGGIALSILSNGYQSVVDRNAKLTSIPRRRCSLGPNSPFLLNPAREPASQKESCETQANKNRPRVHEPSEYATLSATSFRGP